jgi:hypothetical protein
MAQDKTYTSKTSFGKTSPETSPKENSTEAPKHKVPPIKISTQEIEPME